MDRSMIPEWIILNNQIIDENGEIKSLNKDKDAVRSYFLNYVNKKTQFFQLDRQPALKEKCPVQNLRMLLHLAAQKTNDLFWKGMG